MNLTEILTVILLISTSALCIALIYFLYQIVKSVHSVSANIQGLSSQLDPLIHSTLLLSEKLTHTANEAESQLQISRSLVSDIKVRADKILNIESKILNGIEDVAMPLVKNFHALGKGIKSFWRNYRNKKTVLSIEKSYKNTHEDGIVG